MKQALFKTALRSLRFYRKDAFYQFIIIVILAAILCGSLLTGHSVRRSLARSLSEKLGNSDILISSGLRYFNSSLAGDISEKTGSDIVPVLELDGYCQNFSTGASALNTKIYGITGEFFQFHGVESVVIEKGAALINENLSRKLNLKAGDEVIVRFTETDPIPANAPFAPSKETGGSKVFRISGVLTGDGNGNFSLGTTQVIPLNIFVNIDDLDETVIGIQRVNRLLINNDQGFGEEKYFSSLKESLQPADIGLSVRRSAKTGEPELISDRIFIDDGIADMIVNEFPGSSPVITYLANTFEVSGISTPYSFISALPPSMTGFDSESAIMISRWLADDLNAGVGDTILVKWYDPAMGNRLEEKSKNFIISAIADSEFRYSDPSLMPEFPGISGSTTCSSWDAGIPLLTERIRDKDEEYWELYKGTPKAFISYETGKQLWGNNFGPATALRFPPETDTDVIVNKLTGKLDPSRCGFTISDLKEKNSNAASQGVDFGTLFLSLSFFIILSCVILLSMAISLFLNSRKKPVRTYNALGFRNNSIKAIIFYEIFMITVAGAVVGVVAGYLVNIFIIKALNGVWTGAVQTNTLSPAFSLIPVGAGIIVTIIISVFMTLIRLRSFLAGMAQSAMPVYKPHSPSRNLIWLILSVVLASVMLILSLVISANAILLSFAGGSLLFIVMILTMRQFYLGSARREGPALLNYSRLYYRFNPAHAITPALFLAAGIFAVILTGANKQNISDKMMLPAGGTGGYLLWAEAAIPVNLNLNTPEGRTESGFDEEDLRDMKFVHAKRLAGDDASCLNISHVTSPQVLGIDAGAFIAKGSFSFATQIREAQGINPWSLLNKSGNNNIIYGIADQTVLQWGLKIKTGDTLLYMSENGQPLSIIICAGLESSVFQGYLLIGEKNFSTYFPSVAGSSVFLVDGKTGSEELYKNAITDRLAGSGIETEPAIEKLASFFEVTNTYLEVFMMLGALGLILGAAGLGFILMRNFNSRKREFALMMAEGFTSKRIKRFLLKDQLIILFSGVATGTVSALSATWPSVRSGADLPVGLILLMLALTLLTGVTALLLSVNQVNKANLIGQLRVE